jgi:iron complex outermembrane receptor protein
MRVEIARAALLGTVAAAACFTTPALAQDSSTAAPPPPAPRATAAANNEGQDSATGQIVITARRTEERLQRVPASVSAFNERALDRIQAQDTTGLQGAVPNLNIVQGRGSSNATNIFIRGIGQPDALQTFDPAVGVYVDDVYLSRIRGNQLDLLDVDRIEVLRGPQGTLYGKNTIGGAIKFVTRRPGDVFHAGGSIAAGSYGQIDVKGSVSGPLTSGVSAGLAVLRAEHDGYVEDRLNNREYNDKNTIAGRAALAINPSSKIRIDLTADYARDNAKMNVGRPINNLTTFSLTTLVVTDPVGSGKYDWKGETTPGLPNTTKMKHYGFAGTAAIDVTDSITLKSITAYRNLKTDDYIDIDATYYSVGDVFVGVRQHQFSQEFQATYTGTRLNAVAGLYYLKERVRSRQEAYADDLFGPFFGNPTFLRTVDDDLTLHSYAAYANASYEIVPRVRLSGGIRFTKEEKDYFRTTTTFLNGAVFTPPFVFTPHDTWKDTSPMASIDWQVIPSTMLYARVAKGFKSGGFNGRANNPNGSESTTYDPETVWSYEAGFKTTIAGQLRVNGSVFTSNYKDFQARIADTDTSTFPPTPLLSVLNAGKLRINGAELEAAWTPVKALLIDGQLGYLDAKYKVFDDTRFTNFGGSRAFQTPAFAPKWTLRLGAQYAFDLGSAGAITVGGQTRYRSRQALAVDNTFINSKTKVEGLFQDGYWVEDARIVWENPSKKLALGLYGYNLTNKAYKTDAQEFSSVGGIRTVYYGNPRTFVVRLTARY